ncbi:MAG: GTPase Era [Chloroflexi bacterium RBG_16_51_16]|nr:MAG: GTPase Era [Chloroflexi bacterium RBG_16_51_16]
MTNFRSGFVSVIGRSNVGKSTLLNALLGQKVAAVSPRPQTTRRRQLGILTLPNAQVVFIDTPGLHQPLHRLGHYLNQEAKDAIQGIDVILFTVDASVLPSEEDRLVAGLIDGLPGERPILMALNKTDLVEPDEINRVLSTYTDLVHREVKTVPISALKKSQLDVLEETLVSLLPVRPPEFPEDQLTDLYEREIAADLIRAACLYLLRDEVPHSLAVRIDEFKERPQGAAYIAATIFVERDSHKGIVIGQGGKMLKEIGTSARVEIEEMSGRKVFLELKVKVLKQWRNDDSALKRLGYKIKNGSPH